MSQSCYYFGHSDLRSKTPIERAIALHRYNNISFRNAAKACGVSVGAIQRALEAVKENREIGQIGRPRLLSTAQQESFDVDLEASIRPGKRVKYDDARKLVRFFPFQTHCVLTLIPFVLPFFVLCRHFLHCFRTRSTILHSPTPNFPTRGCETKCFARNCELSTLATLIR